jgi:predicted homoserine dehydrogenase-like protein
MSLHRMLRARSAETRPVTVGLIGCGKFASMFLAQVPRTPGLHIRAIADVNVERARATLARVGWEPERIVNTTLRPASGMRCCRSTPASTW